MPKVRGPLFSLAASGTLQKRLTFQDTAQVQTVRFNPERRHPRSPLQIMHGQRVADCRAAWRALPPATKAEWGAHITYTHMTGPALFMREWFAQNVYPPNLPAQPQ